MTPVPRLSRLLLLGGGSLLLLAGIAAAVAGVAIPERLHALLPPVVIDAAAIGGAAVALGVAVAAAGAALVLLGIFLGRPGWMAAGLVSLGLLGGLLIATGVALLTEVAAGAAGWLVPIGVGLLALALLHGVAAWRLAGTRRVEPQAPPEGR